MFAKAFHLFQHRMELEEKGPHPNITEFVKPISNGLRGADQASGCSPVRSNMTSWVSIRPRHHSLPVNTSNCFFKAHAMQPGMFFLGGGDRVPADHERADTKLHLASLFSRIGTDLID